MYVPNPERYAAMAYRRCGKSGLKLPEVSLGLWHNFGDTNTLEHMEAICKASYEILLQKIEQYKLKDQEAV